ncbi:alpha/beta-hydrolase [Meredithblackwellia eburnea MCA 4105]
MARQSIVQRALRTACVFALLLTTNVLAQSTDPFAANGSDSLYWHQRYHGLLVMASYGDYNTTCPQSFTEATLQRQYPGNTNPPFTVLGTWGPTPKFRSKGYMVKVPEMNKVVMVFSDVYGWQQEFNNTLVPYTGIGCDDTCMVHSGAYEAWQEVKEITNDMAVMQANRGSLIFSSVGHGFGGMIVQVAALDLRIRNILWSCYTMGSPPVFNQATATLYASLFTWGGDVTASQRVVANDDSVPAAIPITDGGYSMVLTGVHLFGTNPMYGQNYTDCEYVANNPECLGGSTESDHYFYFTDYGTCGEAGWDATYNTTANQLALQTERNNYYAALASISSVQATATIVPNITSTAVATITSALKDSVPSSSANPIQQAVSSAKAAGTFSAAGESFSISTTLKALSFAVLGTMIGGAAL